MTDLADIYRPLMEEKNQSLETVCRTPIALFANADLIAQMLSNLLDNAIKYTPENGGISIEERSLEPLVQRNTEAAFLSIRMVFVKKLLSPTFEKQLALPRLNLEAVRVR